MYDDYSKAPRRKDVSHGISVLSLTISAAKTILYSLEDDDNISIVTYSSHAELLLVINHVPLKINLLSYNNLIA